MKFLNIACTVPFFLLQFNKNILFTPSLLFFVKHLILLHVFQIEDLRSQLLRAEEDRVELQHQISRVAMHRQSSQDVQEDERRIRTGIALKFCTRCLQIS